ncbi:hypothetical protein C8R41DRAFT_832439 [Lentinula lateritia]|uniref:Uncharacterized protein n=1 Tax=Lentinula lateritia TaxID=40482 RepID=A0ABQ8VFN1_9AGAR|nr:hypothetical protein C8R41DRAFT_832439 [Lentinula lateritia]
MCVESALVEFDSMTANNCVRRLAIPNNSNRSYDWTRITPPFVSFLLKLAVELTSAALGERTILITRGGWRSISGVPRLSFDDGLFTSSNLCPIIP